MSKQTPAGRRPWQATLILSLFVVAVAAAAFIGWRFARESPPHQGPIVLIAVSTAHGGDSGGSTAASGEAIAALSRDAVTFDRAYTQSMLTVPAVASILTGQLPIEHGVRDDAGFVLGDDARTLAELLRGRGFSTGGAASTMLLAAPSGLSQGFSFYDAEMAPPAAASAAASAPSTTDTGAPRAELPAGPEPAAPVTRPGDQTLAAAEQWVGMQDSQRYFLYLEVDRASADTVVGRVVQQLKAKQLYDGATIVLTADHGTAGADGTLDEQALRVPLLVKQPFAEGAGRRVAVPVQQIDLLPTVLDFVRAPIPGGLRGRSLRPLLADDDATLPDTPIYSESLEAAYRLGGLPVYALTTATSRLVRAAQDDVEPLSTSGAAGGAVTEPASTTAAPASASAAPGADLSARLDALLKDHPLPAPAPIAAADEPRLAAAGYGQGLRLWMAPAEPIEPRQQARALAGYRQALAALAGRDLTGAIAALRSLAQAQPMLASVQFQLGALLARAGFTGEALAALHEAEAQRPDDAQVAVALADVTLRARQLPESKRFAEEAVARATTADAPTRVAAQLVSMEVALAERDHEAAAKHATEAAQADPSLPLADFVRGRTAFDEARYEDAAEAFQSAATALKAHDRAFPDLQAYLGDSLTQLQKYPDAEAAFREELRSFPGNARAWAGLALVYHASNREQEAGEALDRLVEAVPTAEGYATAARAWTQVGNRSRAEALRAEARRRFRTDTARTGR